MSAIKSFLAVDLGATLVRASLFDENLNPLHSAEARTRDSIEGKADPNFARTVCLIEELLQKSNREVVGGCIGVPEYVDPNGNLTSSEQIEWHQQPKELLGERFGFRWHVESDVRCAAIAEARNHADFLYVTLSSGISHCLVLDGKPLVGTNGRAIGLGTMRASDTNATVEELASGLGLARRYRDLSGKTLSTAEIMNLYGIESDATSLIESAVTEFALALNHAAMIFDPARIIIGGGFWLGSSLIRELTRSRFNELMSGNLIPEILDARSRNGALIGAGLIAMGRGR